MVILKGLIKVYISIEALLLVTALSIDAFISSFAYGASKIRIPFKSIMIINIIGSVILALSLFFGSLLLPLIPSEYAQIIAFSILFILGITKIFDSTVKTLIRKHSNIDKKVTFSIFDLQFILNVYANPEKADIDSSRIVSPKEAIYLAVALALDSFAVGFGAGLSDINNFQIVAFSLVTDLVAILIGCYIGNKVAQKLSLNMSWLSGVILIALAFSNIL